MKVYYVMMDQQGESDHGFYRSPLFTTEAAAQEFLDKLIEAEKGADDPDHEEREEDLMLRDWSDEAGRRPSKSAAIYEAEVLDACPELEECGKYWTICHYGN